MKNLIRVTLLLVFCVATSFGQFNNFPSKSSTNVFTGQNTFNNLSFFAEINNTYYVGGYYSTPQAAVTAACTTGQIRNVEVPPGTATGVNLALLSGCTNTYVTDKRAYIPLYGTWGGGIYTFTSGGGGGGGVSSVFGRAGAVVAVSGDYSFSLISGVLGSGQFPTLTGDVTNSALATTVGALKNVPFCTGYTPTNGQVLEYTTASAPNPCYTAMTATGGSIPSVTNLLAGNGSGSAADSGIAAANVALLNGASQVFSGTGGIASTNGVIGGVSGSSGNVSIHNQGGFPAVDGQGSLLIRSTGGSNPILLQPATSTSAELYPSGGTYFGTSGFADPGANNVTVQGNVKAVQYTATLATVATATTIAPTTPFVNLTGTTAIATITLPSGLSSSIGACLIFVPGSTVATTTAGNIEAVYTLTAGAAYQGCYNGTKWFFSGVGGSGTGTVTNTGSSLTVNHCVLGNTYPDIKIDTVCLTDGAGNMSLASLSLGGSTQGYDLYGVGTGTITLPSGAPTNYVGIIGPTSGTPTYLLQLPATSPTAGQSLAFAAPTTVNGLSQAVGSWVSGTLTVATGTFTVPVTALAANTCDASATTATATGAVASTDRIVPNYSADPTGITGNGGGTSGGISYRFWITSGTGNMKRCNETSSPITPGAVTMNFSVYR